MLTLAAPGAPPSPREAAELTPPLVPTPAPSLIEGTVPTEHFLIRYTARSKGAAQELSRNIEWVRDRFQRTLGREWPGKTEIRLGADRKELEALTIGNQPPPGWARALAYPEHNVMLVDAISLSEPDGNATLMHELSHVALGQLGRGWPHWFQEGLAMYLTGERLALSHYSALFRATRQHRVVPFDSLSDDWPDHPGDVEIAYAQSVSFVSYLLDHHGREGFAKLLDGVSAGVPFSKAFETAFGPTLAHEEKAWREELAFRFWWLPADTLQSLFILFAALLCAGGFVVHRRRSKLRRAELAAEDDAEDAAARILLAEADPQDALPELPSEDDDSDPAKRLLH